MKKTVGLFILASIAVVLVSCKEKSCSYTDMEYNTATKQCECIQFLDSENAPKLKKNDYNTVLAINQNFYYASVDGMDYPYYSHEGDTIMFTGFILEKKPLYYSYPDSTWVHFSIGDENGGFGSSLGVECLASQFESIDRTQQCYVTGIYSISDYNFERFHVLNSAPPGTCLSGGYHFDVVDIHN